MSTKPAADTARPSFRRRWAEFQRSRRRRGWKLPLNLSSPGNRLLVALLVSLLGLLVTFASVLDYLSPTSEGERVALSTLRRLADEGRVAKAVLHDFDHRVTGEYRTDEGVVRFTADYPASDAQTPVLIDALTRGGAEVSVETETTKQSVEFVATYLLPLVILANLFALIFVGTKAGGGDAMGGLSDFSGIGKGRGKGKAATGAVTFADVAGAEDALVELVEVRDYLADPDRFAALGARPPKGVMLFGPPGCGKTLMARAVAGEAGVPFFSISGAEFVESLVGVGAARVRDLFRQVRQVAPAIIFIDEIDAAGRRRGGVAGGQEEREQTLNQLLIEMDGFDPTAGVVVIAATNRPDILDPALLRPGRFDRQVTVEPPDLDGRIAILRLYADRKPTDDGIDYEYLARRVPGFTGADLANVVNEAALLCVRTGKPVIGMDEMLEAVHRVLVGPKRRGHLMTPEERRRAAYHESAHVLMGALTGRLGDVPRVTIQAHGRNVGLTSAKSWAERTLITRSELFAELVTVMGGIAAEELVFGEASTGGDADIERATSVAQMMAGRYGMSEALGKVRLLQSDGSEFLGGGEMLPAEAVPDELLAQLHAEVRRLVEEADETARLLLAANRGVLDRIVEVLLEHESLEGARLAEMIEPLRDRGIERFAPAPAGNGQSRRVRTARRG